MESLPSDRCTGKLATNNLIASFIGSLATNVNDPSQRARVKVLENKVPESSHRQMYKCVSRYTVQVNR